MTLKNRLQSFHYSTPSISQRNLMKLSILIERLDAKIDSSFELEDDMTEDLANYVLPRFYSQSGDLNYKDLKNIMLLFGYSYDNKVIAKNPTFIRRLLRLIEEVSLRPKSLENLTRNFIRCLNSHYLLMPSEYKNIFNEARNNLTREFSSSKKFLDLYDRYPFYEPTVIQLLTQSLYKEIKGEDKIKERLKELLIRMDESESNIFNLILKEALKISSDLVKIGIKPEIAFQSFLLSPPEIGMRYKKLSKDLLRELLSSFLGVETIPENNEEILKFIETYYGHPIINRVAWIGIDDDLKAIYLKWKARVSMEVFFEAISEGATQDADSEKAQRMWQERRDYWTGILELELISEAWVILGSKAERSFRQEQDEEALTVYGIGDIRTNTKSHIMMKVDNIIFVECSHNGALWAYNAEDERSPKMYKIEGFYSQFDFKKENKILDISHVNNWEIKVDDFIEDFTGINLEVLRKNNV